MCFQKCMDFFHKLDVGLFYLCTFLFVEESRGHRSAFIKTRMSKCVYVHVLHHVLHQQHEWMGTGMQMFEHGYEKITNDLKVEAILSTFFYTTTY